MSKDDHLLLPSPPKPEPTDAAPHPLRRSLDRWALGIALCALLVSAWQARDNRLARVAVQQATDISKESLLESQRANQLSADSLAIAKAASTAAELAASAADRQVQASLEQNALSAASNRIAAQSIRALLTVRAVTFRAAPSAGQPLVADVHVVNTGQSEATSVRIRATAVLARVIPEGPMPAIAPPPNSSTGVLAPGGQMTMELLPVASDLREHEIKDLKLGRVNIFAFGLVEYVAAGTKRYTEFCYVPDPVKIERALVCEKWNAAR